MNMISYLEKRKGCVGLDMERKVGVVRRLPSKTVSNVFDEALS